jgi:competence protein ComEA
VKPFIAIVVVAAVAAAVLLRPVPPPVAATPTTAWTTVSPPPRIGRAASTPPPRAVVYVAGAVPRPGVYTLASDARVRDAVALAGGMRPNADPVAVNLAAHLRDGDEVVVPVRGEPVAPAAGSSRKRGRRGQPVCGGTGRGHERRGGSRGSGSTGAGCTSGRHWSRRDEAPPSSPIDLNTANAELLATVPGIGAGLAVRIVAFRDANGPFTTADELLDVSGMTDRRLDAIAPYVIAR